MVGGEKWWIAINGSSCAACPWPANEVHTIPRAWNLIGFPTREEQLTAQKLLLTASQSRMRQYLERLLPRIESGEIGLVVNDDPDPSTRGSTRWLMGRELRDVESLRDAIHANQ